MDRRATFINNIVLDITNTNYTINQSETSRTPQGTPLAMLPEIAQYPIQFTPADKASSAIIYARAWLLPLTLPLLIAGALISLRVPVSIICFRGVNVPCAKLLARPRRSRICASASSLDIVAPKADLGSANRVEGGVASSSEVASGIRVVVDTVWNVGTRFVFSSSLCVGLLGASSKERSDVLTSATRAGAGGSQDGVRA
jgi:hypothetical protein